MPANWTGFIANLTGEFSSYSSDDENQGAEKIVNAYHQTVSTANTILTLNMPINNGNAQRFLNVLRPKMNLAMNTYTPSGLAMQHFADGINTGVIAYWTGAILGTTYYGMPPAHISFLGPNIVLNPGICLFTPQQPTMSPLEMPAKLAIAFQAHLLTIQGLHTMIRPPEPAPPYPLNWVGVM